MANVKVYRYTDAGAPVLASKPGSLITLFDAVLVNGYGEHDVTTSSISDGLITLNTENPHGFKTNDWVLVSGATEASLNTEHRVTVETPTSMKFRVSGVSGSSVAGTVKVKRAPAGFEKPFQKANVGVYRSKDLSSTRMFFKIEDTGVTPAQARCGRLFACEVYTAVDVGEGAFTPDHNYIFKGLQQDNQAGPAQWLIVSNGKTVYFFTGFSSQQNLPGAVDWINRGGFTMFGDYISNKPGDAYNAMAIGTPIDSSAGLSSNNGSYVFYTSDRLVDEANRRIFSPRATNELPNQVAKLGVYAGIDMASPPLPFSYSPRNGEAWVCEAHVYSHDPGGYIIYGKLPGMYAEYSNIPGTIGKTTLKNIQGLPGRTLLNMGFYGYSNSAHPSVWIDITGPWE